MISQTASPSAPESASRRMHPNEHAEVLMTDDLVKIYAGRAVVNGISLNVGQGEIVGFPVEIAADAFGNERFVVLDDAIDVEHKIFRAECGGDSASGVAGDFAAVASCLIDAGEKVPHELFFFGRFFESADV